MNISENELSVLLSSTTDWEEIIKETESCESYYGSYRSVPSPMLLSSFLS